MSPRWRATPLPATLFALLQCCYPLCLLTLFLFLQLCYSRLIVCFSGCSFTFRQIGKTNWPSISVIFLDRRVSPFNQTYHSRISRCLPNSLIYRASRLSSSSFVVVSPSLCGSKESITVISNKLLICNLLLCHIPASVCCDTSQQ